LSRVLNDIYIAQSVTISVYPRSVYGSSAAHPTIRGLRYAKINENISSVRELYTRDVATANTVLNIRNIKVVVTERRVASDDTSFPSKYLPERITR
jgi:hypothetical protein